MNKKQYNTRCPLIKKLIDLAHLIAGEHYKEIDYKDWERVTCLYFCPSELCLDDARRAFSQKVLKLMLPQLNVLPPCPKCQMDLSYKDIPLEGAQCLQSKLGGCDEGYKCWGCGFIIPRGKPLPRTRGAR